MIFEAFHIADIRFGQERPHLVSSPMKNHGKHIGNIWNRYGQKLRRIILRRLGVVDFSMGETENASFSWFLDFWTCPLLPKTNYFYFSRRQDTQNNPRTIPHNSNKIWGIANFRTSFVLRMLKRRAPKILEIRPIHSTWDQYLPEKLWNWFSGNMRELRLWNLEHWDKKPRNVDAKKL